ncbi:MAG: tRNA uridine-5-carboxymethylaminomethyl(34) synthesis GTPase MnmE [Nitrosomonadales bacterium]|jgi:tRNA modification GTPase|nr:tRNA uridine-5-carboxymethylaminomethyl(34) synthesis GTPase MnmE [Nitrosomonadales bacterium]MBT4182883.1 tRNA uridine-5-carboxymethylaminomethyl(34) synthesis GTPase MnmE [Nitrosomonadales bacterium]MBT4571512.1 tRNA uridine-5-carboxymethylaminomethyl(34) synthesis GTPase MnmE [Nitrosomonadales bacterium]MBT5150187.1 tRNA uridine-5-carboxymethylaminomethyl(34) synthesis GTPase MnmE [Nitrosomonadales bacterium]MBT6818523.1 tRNA uridine-5-carboxymethylaminomethyl(34) synthesis GTPase MnmE [N
MLNDSSTIAAISTAKGVGGIGVVRISGNDSLKIANKICNVDITPRKAHFSTFKDKKNITLDQGVVIYFPSPASFTGEDIVELQGHGGVVVLNLILKSCLSYGARLAAPGEFTKRAFLNNKLDLSQAESVADLINASTEAAAKSAINSLSGSFSNKINDLLNKLIDLRVFVEACLDFPEEDINFIDQGKVDKKLKDLNINIYKILDSAKQGQLLRDGVKVVLIGQPNVGKSSLMNQLARQNKAIVTEIPGTTRDPIKSDINIQGIPIHLTDTAGLRNTEDVVEKFGIDKTWESIEEADIAIILADVTVAPAKYEEIIINQLPKSLNKIFVKNKIDLLKQNSSITYQNNEPQIFISAMKGDGIILVENEILKIIGKEKSSSNKEDLFMARSRHIEALEKVKSALNNATLNLQAPELVAEELMIAQKSLSKITGEFSSDDLLGQIFGEFCIGK